MITLERKRFLQAAGGGTLAVLGFLYPGAADAARRTRQNAASKTVLGEQTGPDPTYAGGEVVATTADGVVLQTPTTARAVRIAPDDVVWKEFNTRSGVIEIGDWLDVKGQPQIDGSLVATNGMVFVNIARRDGVIEKKGSRGMRLRNEHGQHDIEFSAVVEFVDAADGSALAGGGDGLQVGHQIGAVGVQLPGGRFRATRVWR